MDLLLLVFDPLCLVLWQMIVPSGLVKLKDDSSGEQELFAPGFAQDEVAENIGSHLPIGRPQLVELLFQGNDFGLATDPQLDRKGGVS